VIFEGTLMQLTVTTVDHAPEELYDQVPFAVQMLRELPGPDRPDYWLGRLEKPIRWLDNNIERRVTHLVLAARWQGTRIEAGVEHLPVGIAYVTDVSLLDDEELALEKCRYVAIGISTETGGGKKPRKLTEILSGSIGRAFGTGKRW
jgi:hypothetical protein